MTASRYHRDRIFPEETLPDALALVQNGKTLASTVGVGSSAFLNDRNVSCESYYKRNCAANNEVMVHSQIGYRDPAKTMRAYREIWQHSGDKDARVDRYGICLDWSMGFPRANRSNAQMGTGLILHNEDAFAELTAQAPVAAHFGDFVMGTPAALENTIAALKAGSTAIGNLGQYFTFRLPGHDDDVTDTASTLEALALAAAQPTDILIHSNLDDGFAALFTDLACSLGAVLLEQYVVEDLIGGNVSHCYGHSFSEPFKRLAFQLALQRVSRNPGTMVYGNTVAYEGDGPENYAALGAYLSVDITAQMHRASGHAINPVPITEAARIPDIDEVVDAVVFASRMIERVDGNGDIFAIDKAEAVADDLISGAQRFKAGVLDGLSLAGIDITNPFEMLLSLRRIGAKRLEEAFGPGTVDDGNRRGRRPILQASTIAALEAAAQKHVSGMTDAQIDKIRSAELIVCVCASDVHEYGKILLTEVLKRSGISVIDAGVHADPTHVAALAHGVSAVAISTYNGIALDYLSAVNDALVEQGIDVPVLIGGKMNQIPHGSNTSLPVDVSGKLDDNGAIVCRSMDDLIPHLLSIAERDRA